MSEVRKIMATDINSPNLKVHVDGFERVETGGLQINDDWPGLFIRGDRCIDLLNRLAHAKNYLNQHVPTENKREIGYMLAFTMIESLESLIEEEVVIKPGADIPQGPEP